ncbi:MAG TPA: MFS transporter, partial [Acidimicrobiales bacterium]|nr:MFS transporter [Acidimicrobiales bacterium]
MDEAVGGGEGQDLESSEPPGTEPPDPGAVALRHNRSFQMLWIGQVLSDLGSQFGTLAYPLLVLALTHSPLVAGAVATITSGVAFLVRLPAGALADRLDRRLTMIVCDAVRAVVLCGLAVAVAAHSIDWPVVLVVAIVDRLGDTLFTPASTAALPAIVENEQLEAAWAATEARQYAANLGGPALGGLLFSLGRAIPFVGDAVSYGASVLTSSRLKGNFGRHGDGERKGLWKEAFDGVLAIWHDPILRAVVAQAPLINFAFAGALFTVTLGLRHHGTSATVIGLVQAGIMIGGLLGAVAAPKLQGRWSLSQLVVFLTLSGTGLFAVAAVLMPSPWVALPIAIPLVVSPTTNAALFATLIRQTPADMRGRVNNALLQVATGLAALAPLAAGALVSVSSHWAMGAFAVALGVS